MTKKKTISANRSNSQPPIVKQASATLIEFINGLTFQLCLTGLLAFLVYSNSLSNQYALDDGMVLKENKFVQRGISGIPDILSHDSFYGSIGESANLVGGRYRPLSLIVYAIEVSLFGNNPFIHHLFNILFHVITCLVLLLFLRRFVFSNRPYLGLFAALIFALHPIHTEVVANIKSLDEILSLLFLLLTLYSVLISAQNPSRKSAYLLSIICYLLAIFSKENGFTFILIIPLTLWFFTGDTVKKILLISIPYFLIAALHVAIRIAMIGTRNQEVLEVMDNPYFLASPLEKYSTILFVFLKYFKLLVWPFPLTYDYSYNQIPYRDLSDIWVWISFFLHAALVLYALYGLRRKDLISWCIIFYLSSIFIVSNIVFNIGAPMAERFLFQPSVAFVMALMIIVERVFKRISSSEQLRVTSLATVLTPIFIVFAFVTINRNKDWKSDQTLFLHDVKISSGSARANTYAGVALIRLCDQSTDSIQKRTYALQALNYFRKSSEIKSDYIATLLNMGVAYSRLDSVEEAEAIWIKARQKDPDAPNLELYDSYLAESYYRMGLEQGAKNNFPLSVQYLEKAVRYDPKNAEAWYNLGGAYYSIKSYDLAKSAWETCLKLNPAHEQAKAGLKALGY